MRVPAAADIFTNSASSSATPEKVALAEVVCVKFASTVSDPKSKIPWVAIGDSDIA